MVRCFTGRSVFAVLDVLLLEIDPAPTTEDHRS
jgi:hypothetical protein